MCHSYMLVKCAFVCFVNVVLSGFDMMCACAKHITHIQERIKMHKTHVQTYKNT